MKKTNEKSVSIDYSKMTEKSVDYVLYLCKKYDHRFKLGNFAYFPRDNNSIVSFHLRKKEETKYEIMESEINGTGILVELWKRYCIKNGIDYTKLVGSKSYMYSFSNETDFSREIKEEVCSFKEDFLGVGKVIELDVYGNPVIFSTEGGLEIMPISWVLVSYDIGYAIKKILNTIPIYKPSKSITDEKLKQFHLEYFKDYYAKLKVLEALQIFLNKTNLSLIDYNFSKEFENLEDFEEEFCPRITKYSYEI